MKRVAKQARTAEGVVAPEAVSFLSAPAQRTARAAGPASHRGGHTPQANSTSRGVRCLLAAVSINRAATNP